MTMTMTISRFSGEGGSRNIYSKLSLNDGGPKDADFPSPPLFDNSLPFNLENHFKNEHNQIGQPSLQQQPFTQPDLITEIKKSLHTEHLDPSTPFQTPSVLEFGHSRIDVNNNDDFRVFENTHYTSPTQVSSADCRKSDVFIAMGCGVGFLLLLLLMACVAIRMTKKTQPDAAPASNDLPPPYSECINKPVREEPRPFFTDTELLANNNHLFETGFTNKCVAMTTAPNTFGDHKTEFVFDNGRIVERLSVNERGHFTRRADNRDNVVYVDIHSKAVL